MSGPTDITQAVAKFSNWATSEARDLSVGLDIISTAFEAEEIQLSLFSGSDHYITHSHCKRSGYSQTPKLYPLESNIDLTLNSDHRSDNLEQISSPCGVGYCVIFKGILAAGEITYFVALRTNEKSDMQGEASVFLKMAAPQIAYIATRSKRRKSALTYTREALESIDDGVIIYDENDKLVLHNERYREMFPSVAAYLDFGVSYDALLREQAKNNPLHGSEAELEGWIHKRKRNLHTHQYQEEQSFASGKTFRLTNYKLKSGGTISIRNDITELVEAREAAEHSEKLFRTLLQGAPVALAVTAKEKVLFANELMYRLLEAEDGTLIDVNTKSFFDDPRDHDTITDLLLKTDTLMGHTVTIRTSKGKAIVVSITGSHITYHGRPALFYSLVDVTETQQNREALKRSEKQKRDILELIPDALLVQQEGKIVYVNKGAQHILGASSTQELLGMDGLDILPRDQRHEMLRLRERALENGRPLSQRTRHRRVNGEEFHSEIYTTSINWNGVKSTLNVIKDISRRHQYEEQLKKNEREMLLAQNIGNFGHWRMNVETGQITWSKTLYDLHGFSYDTEITHETVSALLSEEDRARRNQTIADATETGEITHYEVEVDLPHHTDKRIFAGSLLAEFGEHGEVTSIFGVLEDMTERRTMEEQFRQSQKMEAVGQLTGGIAHDFNNLLAIILGNAELLSEEVPSENTQLHHHANSIVRAATRGAELVNSMLAFSRSQELRPERTFLTTSVTPLLDLLKRTIEENINIDIELDHSVWPCIADVGQVENALLNLSLNARDAMPKGGALSIAIKNSTLTENLTTPIDEILAGEYVCLTVKDTGQGIPPEKLKRVFDPFFTTKDVGKGTGLGLSMVYGFIRQSNGFVNIQSEPDIGTIVELYLPRDYSEVSALEI
ncbi:MAG: PAS domain S-box protein [Sneathiella sp.]|nr:PAS domain S-box protein [Sneathiella sp.]